MYVFWHEKEQLKLSSDQGELSILKTVEGSMQVHAVFASFVTWLESMQNVG